MNVDDLKLTDPQFFARGNAHAIWSELRASDPVHLTANNRFDHLTLLAEPEFVSSIQLCGPKHLQVKLQRQDGSAAVPLHHDFGAVNV